MPNHWVTFRLHEDSTYDDRYSGFMDELYNNASSHWDEPTSFVCLETTLSPSALGNKLKAHLSSKDLFVIREIGKDNTVYFGSPDKDFKTFFPKAKKL